MGKSRERAVYLAGERAHPAVYPGPHAADAGRCDGEYDFVIDRTNPNVEAKQWLQAYKRDGTLLWQMDMGPNSVDHYNITPGSSTIGIGHGDNVTVYDLDGDGKAEVI